MPTSNTAKDHDKQGVKQEPVHQENSKQGDGERAPVNEIASDLTKSRHRPRKRKLFMEICKQLEFYFSDSNITKNRMMHDIVVSSEYVDLKKLLEFNKMKQMTASVEDLQKAVANSHKLVLSPDKTGVKRINSFDPTKLKDNSTIEECTIYVENVPKHVDHKWLETIFQVFGPIAYISLPKFKHNGQPKGFAFVEYESPEGSSRCLEAYGQQGACLSTDLDPSELLSIQTFADADNSSTGHRLGEESVDNLQVEATDKIDDSAKKRKLEPDEEEKEDIKRIKLENESEIKPKDLEPLSSTKATVTESVKKSKKKRKQNKTKKTTEEKLESDSIKFRVMPKKTWRQLRSRYLNLQRENMSKLKRQLRQQFKTPPAFQNYKSKREDNSWVQSYPPYNVVQDTSGVKPKSKIVKIYLSTPSESEEIFKKQISVDLAGQGESDEGNMELGIVKYVDYTAGQLEAYVRLDADPSVSDHIVEFVQKAGRVFKSVELLTEKEGDDYWQFVRQSHKNKKQKKCTRGRDRLLQAASKSNHIHFDEDFGAPSGPNVETAVS